MYKELLIENDIPTVEPKPRSDVIDNSRRVGGPSTDSIGKDRLGKERIGEDREGKERIGEDREGKDSKDLSIGREWSAVEEDYGEYKWQREDHLGYVLLSKENPPVPKANQIIKRAHYVYKRDNGLDTIPSGYHINHINHIRNDDRIENLELLTASEHISKHHKEGIIPDPRNPDVQELWDYGLSIGFQATKQSGNRYAITRLLKAHGKDLAKKYAHYSQAIRQHQYAPQINNWMDLEEKLLKLRDFAERQKKKSQRIVNIDL